MKPSNCIQCQRPTHYGHFCIECRIARREGSGREKAHGAVGHAIRIGVLKPPYIQLCVDCGARAKEYDHRDYAKPLAVEAVCHTCNIRRGPGKWIQFTPLRDMRPS